MTLCYSAHKIGEAEVDDGQRRSVYRIETDEATRNCGQCQRFLGLGARFTWRRTNAALCWPLCEGCRPLLAFKRTAWDDIFDPTHDGKPWFRPLRAREIELRRGEWRYGQRYEHF